MAPTSTSASSRLAPGSTRRIVGRGSRRGGGILAIWFALTAAAFAGESVDALLARAEAPFGVVFEIVEGDEDALERILPEVRRAIAQIRARYPDAEFAVVSHGREEFALQTQYQSEYEQVHQDVQSLVAADVPVHVCETHAGWYGVTAEDFPDYVDVAPTGPGQVRAYLDLGYDLIVMD